MRTLRERAELTERGFAARKAAAALALGLSLVLLGANASQAAGRHAAMVIDANSGEPLLNEKADEPRYPASLTKMMTIYMVFEQLESGRLMPWTKLKVSQEAASAQPTKLDLEPGEQIAVMDAVKALITKSANDMAIVLAEAIGGTEAKFAELMTQKARAISMRNTTFRNASGLPDSEQVTTARDMLTLALRLQDDFPKHYPLFATKAFAYNGATHRNHNTLLGTVEGIDGIKTGYTRMSGFNLVTSMRRGEKHIVAAVFGGATAGTRNATMRMMLTRALLKASTKKTRKLAPVLIAKAKPAVKPAVAAPVAVAVAQQPAMVAKPRATPAIAAAAPKIAPLPPTKPIAVAAAPEPTPIEPTLETTEAAAPVEAAAPIEIAKVRPVMVALRVRPVSVVSSQPITAAEVIQTSATSAATAALSNDISVPMTSDPVAPRSALPPQQTGTFAQPRFAAALNGPAPLQTASPTAVSINTPAVAPSPTPKLVIQPIAATLPSTPTSMPVAFAPAIVTQAAVPVPVARGAAPSTLQAQAQGLQRSAPPAAAPIQMASAAALPSPQRLRGSAPQLIPATAPTSTTGGFQIQIGAYASATEAERVLRDTQARSAALLSSAKPMTTPVQKENRLIYRARFAGFDARGAADTCLALRRAAVDCFVMKAE